MEPETLFAVVGVAAGLGSAVVAWIGSMAFHARRAERLSALNDELMAMLRNFADEQATRPAPARRPARKAAHRA